MGIYDRQYVRVGPRSGSGLGSLRFVSVNSWIIIVNVAVFVLSVLTLQIATLVPMDATLRKQVPYSQLAVERGVRNDFGTEVDPRTVPVNGSVQRVLIDKRTGEVVGSQKYTLMPVMYAWGHFSTALGFFGLQLWRFITFQFLHAGLLHLLFNMVGLWVFGGMVEQYLGSRRYLAFYLTCGIFGAVGYLILNFLGNVVFPNAATLLLNDSIHTPLVGASAGVFGVILACAYIAPNAMVVLLFPPIPLKLKWLAYAYVAFAAWNLLRQGQNAGGDAAHIGGAIAGAFFIRNAHLLRDFFDVFRRSDRRGRFPPGAGGRGPVGRAGRSPGDDAEVDRILRKVTTGGLASLTEDEKRTLRRASEGRRARAT